MTPQPSLSPISMVMGLRRHSGLLLTLVKREVTSRYRGSMLGILWSFLTPLFMLAVYTVVFGTVFRARWHANGDQNLAAFAIVLFAGLTVFQLFSEVITRSPSLVLNNQNYVKKVVFPLEVLPVVSLGSALFQALVSFALLFCAAAIVIGHVPLTAILLPVAVAPYLLYILGFSWFLSALGVYFRDTQQALGPIITVLPFMSPVFFPTRAVPEVIRPYIQLNPITVPVEEVRNVLIWGNLPNWWRLGIYATVGMVVASLGYAWFQKTRKGFADVL